MPKSVNKVILVGNVGKDPEVGYSQSGTSVANFSLATNERFKDRNDEWQELTESHSIVAWQRLAEIVGEYVAKGSKLYVEGRIQTSSWEDMREAWYARQVKDGVQVVICHPKLVETGLDLPDFPTIIFYESGYSLHTLRQASRRSWRIGQRRPVRVKFLCAEGTMQTSCLRLMGKKLLVALTMEGKFAGGGLQSIDEDDDMLSAMARELVERNGIGESADPFWRALTAEHRKLFPTNPRSEDDASSIETPRILVETHPGPTSLVEGAMDAASSIVVFGQRPQALSGKRRRARSAVPEQASLFSLS